MSNHAFILERTAFDDRGSAPIVGLLVAAAVVVSALATAIAIVANEAQVTKGESQQLRNVANDALHVIVTEQGLAGTASSSSTLWHDDADRLLRFGLASEKGRNFLDGDKISSLRRAKMTATANELPDYEDVKTALGLDDYEFHLRSYPIVYSVDDERWQPFRGMTAAYIGNYVADGDDPPAITLAVSTVEAPDPATSDYVIVRFTIACDGIGQSVEPDVFMLETSLSTGNGNANAVPQLHNSPVINCWSGSPSSGTIDVRYERMAWAADPTVSYTLTSGHTNHVYPAHRNQDYELTGVAAGSESYTLVAKAELHNYYDTLKPSLVLDRVDKKGASTSTVIVVDVEVTWTHTDGTPKSKTYEDLLIPASTYLTHPLEHVDLTNTGAEMRTFTAKVTMANATGDAEQTTHFTYTQNEVAPSGWKASETAKAEQGALVRLLGDSFKNKTYFNNVGAGDVFRDHNDDTMKTLSSGANGQHILWRGRDGLNVTDAEKEDNYDILVVGSNVAGNAMTNDMKETIKKWVKHGNTLIVLGVATGSVAQWMNAVLDVSFDGGGGQAGNGISAPDETHPVLTSPEQLSWRSYNSDGRRYEFSDAVEDGFTHVVVETGTAKDLLAISNPGTYEKGTVMLSSFMPGDLGVSGNEIDKFMNNMLTQSLHQMLIDFGPVIPASAPVASASRLTVVPHPHDPTLFVELKLVLYVWQ